MIDNNGAAAAFHNHVFLGEGHEKSERKTWAVIWLCGIMMAQRTMTAQVRRSAAR